MYIVLVKYIHVDKCDSAVMSLFFRRCNLNVRWLCKGEWVTHTLCNVIFYNVRLSKKIPWFVRKLEYSFDYIHVMLVTGAGVAQIIDNKDLFVQMEIVKAAQPKTV